MAVNERMVEYKVLALACLKSLDFCVVLIISKIRASLVAQWLRIRLPMQGTWVQVLVREDPTCHGATKPVCHNY